MKFRQNPEPYFHKTHIDTIMDHILGFKQSKHNSSTYISYAYKCNHVSFTDLF